MCELRPVRVVGILHTAVEVPPRATRMPYIEHTAEDDTLYSFAGMIECRALWSVEKGIL